MSDGILSQESRASAMRLEFDRAFAQPPGTDAMVEDDFLAIRLGEQGYALHLAEIGGLFVNKRITGFPSRVPTLMGIAGFRGNMTPVYDLHLLLGHPRIDKPNWLVVASSTHVALAFEAFDRHLRIPREAIVPCEAGQQSRHVREFISTDGLTRPIVHLPSILEVIVREAPEQVRRGGTRDV